MLSAVLRAWRGENGSPCSISNQLGLHNVTAETLTLCNSKTVRVEQGQREVWKQAEKQEWAWTSITGEERTDSGGWIYMIHLLQVQRWTISSENLDSLKWDERMESSATQIRCVVGGNYFETNTNPELPIKTQTGDSLKRTDSFHICCTDTWYSKHARLGTCVWEEVFVVEKP